MELQQESIPVGCVPSTCLTRKCCPRVVLSGGRCVQSGGAVHGILSGGGAVWVKVLSSGGGVLSGEGWCAAQGGRRVVHKRK